MDRDEWGRYVASWCDGNGRTPELPPRARPLSEVGVRGWTVWGLQPVLPHGCPRCCPTCNVDRHACPGCGEPLAHGVGVCLRCRNQ